MIFINPSEIQGNYLKQYENDKSSPVKYYTLTESYDRKSYIEKLNLLDKYFPDKGTLLEIGSNVGTFLVAAKKHGWDVSGVEPNKRACKYVRGIDKEITVYNRYFDNKFLADHQKKYDMIFSSDVIEHMTDPVKFLSISRALLKAGGIVVIITPDFDCLLTKIFQIKPTEHLTYMKKSNIDGLFSASKLRILETLNTHRCKSAKAVLYSTTFTNDDNKASLMFIVKMVKALHLYFLVEWVLDLFKEELMIIARR